MKRTVLFLLLAFLVMLLSGCALVGGGSPATPVPIPTQVVPLPTLPLPTETPPAATQPAPTQVSGQPVSILEIHMIDAANGWAIGETIPGTLQHVLATADGGQTWEDVSPADQSSKGGATATAVLAAYGGVDLAWVIYFTPIPASSSDSLFVWKTTDRGQTWQAGNPLSTVDLTMEFFLPGEMVFSDPQNGWLMAHLGAGMNHDYIALYRTVDSGINWERVQDPSTAGNEGALPMVCPKTGLTFVDAQTGWTAGNCNGVMPGLFLYQTTDGGVSWSEAELPAPPERPTLLSTEEGSCGTLPPVFADEQNGVLPVSCLLPGGGIERWLYRTSDGGATWTPDSAPAPAPYGQVDMAGSDTGFLLGSTSAAPSDGQRSLYTSPDGGQTWQPVLADVPWNGTIDFVDGQHGWAVARGDAYRLLRTTDGGKTWEDLRPQMLP